MTIEKIHHSGAWQVSSIVGGYLVTRTYYGYTKREAMALYRAETSTKRGDKCESTSSVS